MLLNSTSLFCVSSFCDISVLGVMCLVTLHLGVSEGPVITSTSYGTVTEFFVCLFHNKVSAVKYACVLVSHCHFL